MSGILNQWNTGSCSNGNSFEVDWDGNVTVREKGQYLIYSRVILDVILILILNAFKNICCIQTGVLH